MVYSFLSLPSQTYTFGQCSPGCHSFRVNCTMCAVMNQARDCSAPFVIIPFTMARVERFFGMALRQILCILVKQGYVYHVKKSRQGRSPRIARPQRAVAQERDPPGDESGLAQVPIRSRRSATLPETNPVSRRCRFGRAGADPVAQERDPPGDESGHAAARGASEMPPAQSNVTKAG